MLPSVVLTGLNRLGQELQRAHFPCSERHSERPPEEICLLLRCCQRYIAAFRSAPSTVVGERGLKSSLPSRTWTFWGQGIKVNGAAPAAETVVLNIGRGSSTAASLAQRQWLKPRP